MYRKLPQRVRSALAALYRGLYAILRDYVLVVRGSSEGGGIKALRALARGGPRYWLGLAVLLASLVATVYLRIGAQSLPVLQVELFEGESIMVPTPALWLAPLVMAFGWAYLLSGAAGYGLGPYVVAAAYTTYYGLFPGLPRAQELWFAALPWWLLVQGAWVASAQTTGPPLVVQEQADAGTRPTPSSSLPEARSQRWAASRYAWLLLLSMLMSLLTLRATMHRAILPGLWSQALLGVGYWALIANPLALRPRTYRPAVSFALNLGLYMGFYALCLVRVPTHELMSLTFLSFHHLLGAVGLFYFFMGLDLLNSARSLAQWATLVVKRLLRPSLLRVLVIGAWVAWLIYAWLALNPLPMPVMEALWRYSWGRTLLLHYRDWHVSFMWADVLDYGRWVAAGLLGVAVVLALRRRLSSERVLALFNLSLLALLALWGGMGLFYALGGAGEGSATVSADGRSALTVWPLLIYVVGMFWEVLKNSGDLVTGSRRRLSLYLGFLLCLGGISLLEIGSAYRIFEEELSINAFSGALYLGLPYLAYVYLYEQHRYTPVSRRHLVLLFGLGMLTAIPALAGRATGEPGLTLTLSLSTPLLWLVVLRMVMWRRGRWDDPLDGPVYGLALGLGAAAYYTHPVVIPIPAYLGVVAELLRVQNNYTAAPIYPWDRLWWAVFMGAAMVSGALGYGLGLLRRRSCAGEP